MLDKCYSCDEQTSKESVGLNSATSVEIFIFVLAIKVLEQIKIARPSSISHSPLETPGMGEVLPGHLWYFRQRHKIQEL